MNLLILSLSLITNDGSSFTGYSSGVPSWYVSHHACPHKAVLSFSGPPGEVIRVQWTDTFTQSADNSSIIGQPWIDVSVNITLTGEPQQFSVGAFEGTGFYRLRKIQ